jgi:hypothetical protein
VLTADFSTTTPVTRIASQITIMEAMSPYFEYLHLVITCGIPEITLLGTPDDWQKVLDKTKALAKYDLQWWTSELVPLLKEFVKASRGNADVEFWKNMFKYHSKMCAPGTIDGWIVKFFPYDKDGLRQNLTEFKEFSVSDIGLPEEIVKVDLKHILHDPFTGVSVETPLELWAGFIGLEQNPKNFALTPTIGWMIRKKDVENSATKRLLDETSRDEYGSIDIRVKELPEEILALPQIRSLNVEFVGKIIVPDRLAQVKIEQLRLTGEITPEEIERIKRLFPNTQLTINDQLFTPPSSPSARP